MTRTGRPLAMPAEERKKEVYVAAEKLFGERGYEKVTMTEIAAQAGMSKKTLYVYFADKEARSEEHTSELQSLMRISYAVFCLKKKNNILSREITHTRNTIKIYHTSIKE